MDNHDQTNKYFQCNTCDANFSRKDSLKRYMKTHEKAVKDNFTPEYFELKGKTLLKKSDQTIEATHYKFDNICESAQVSSEKCRKR